MIVASAPTGGGRQRSKAGMGSEVGAGMKGRKENKPLVQVFIARKGGLFRGEMARSTPPRVSRRVSKGEANQEY